MKPLKDETKRHPYEPVCELLALYFRDSLREKGKQTLAEAYNSGHSTFIFTDEADLWRQLKEKFLEGLGIEAFNEAKKHE